MLPTKEDDNVLLRKLKQNGNLVFHNFLEHECQHLYVLSNDEVKEGEWCFEVHNGPSLAPKSTPRFTDNKGNIWWLRQLNMNASANDPNCKKVIASTDPNVFDYAGDFDYYKQSIFKIPQSFIEFFMKEHNDGRKIEKINVEYEEVVNCPDNSFRVNLPLQIDMTYCPNCAISKKLKINPDNTISIKPSKTNWNREEVESLLLAEAKYFGNYQEPNDFSLVKTWINKNL